jgi:hypothetical protein
MQSRKSILSAFTLGTAMAFGAAAMGADLPKSGTIKTHIGIKSNSVVVPVGEKHVLIAGTVGAVIYNEPGDGPLHGDAWNCVSATDFDNGAGRGQGYCVTGDASGLDRIFVTFSGATTDTGYAGTGIITGGTGRYSGIQGKLAYPVQAGVYRAGHQQLHAAIRLSATII